MTDAGIDLAAELSGTGALLQGHFRLSSGLHSPAYVQCARLLEHPRVAREAGEALAAKVSGWGAERVIAPALGGVVIGYTVAQALHVPMIFTERKDGGMVLRRGFTIDEAKRAIVVEDVVTTGKSTREAAEVARAHGAKIVGFASILNRSGQENPFDLPFVSLHKLDLESWEESGCPLCARGIPIDTPGSRF